MQCHRTCDTAEKPSCILLIHFHFYSRSDFNLAEFKDYFFNPSISKRVVTSTNTLQKGQFWNATSEIQKYQTRVRLNSSCTCASCQISPCWSLLAVVAKSRGLEMRWSLMFLPTQTILGFWAESTNWKREIFILWVVGRRRFGGFSICSTSGEWCWWLWEHWGASMGWNMGKISLHLLLKWGF